MKKSVLIVILIFFFSWISASYECSDNNPLINDQDEIYLYDRTSINGIGIGVTYSDETALTGSYSAILITDAMKFSLSGSENSTEVELKTKTSTISLLNITLDEAQIKVDDDTEWIEEGDTGTANSLKVFLSKVEGVYPGSGIAEGIIGKEVVSLSNKELSKIVLINDVNYVIELFAASDTNAIIKVRKCQSEDANIIEIADVVELPVEIVNESIGIANNSINTSEEINQTTQESNKSNTGIIDLKGKNRFVMWLFFGIIIIIFLIVISLIYLGSKSP